MAQAAWPEGYDNPHCKQKSAFHVAALNSRPLHGKLTAVITERPVEGNVDKIFVDEAVNELHTIQDMLRWAVSRFAAANIWYGHGTDNPRDEAVQLVLPTLYLPLDIPEEMRNARLTSSERHRIVERVIRRVNERIPVAYLTNKARFCGHEFYVDERVLVPRSPIGELINSRFAGLLNDSPRHITDMCTGSACIAIACARAFRKRKWTRSIFLSTRWRLPSRTLKSMA